MRRTLMGAWNIMGADERIVLGDAVDEILAVAGVDPDQLSESQVQAIKDRVMAKNALVVKDVPPRNSRRFPLGFESAGTVAAGATVTITSRPQVLFKGERLVLPSDIAGNFTIDDLKVGKNSQFVAEGSIPGRVLQENATRVEFDLDTAQISQDISLILTNIGGAPVTFRAALWGLVAE